MLLAGCDDPRDPGTWTKKLRNPQHRETAVRKIKKLGDKAKTDKEKAKIAKVAVPELCKIFKDHPEAMTLKTIIMFGDKSSVAVQTLIEALDFAGEDYHNATLAAKALAAWKSSEAVEPLGKILERPLAIKSRANLAKQAAIEALGKIGDPKGVPYLMKCADKSWTEQDFHLNKKAIEALGRLRDPKAVPTLVRGLFMTSPRQGHSFNQARLALVRVGKAAIPAVIKALQRKDASLEKMAKEQEFRPGVIRLKASVALGDLRAREAVPAMLEILGKANVGEKYEKGLDGLIEGLGKIGDERSLELLHKLILDKKTNVKIRQWIGATLAVIGNKKSLPVLLTVADKGDVQGYPDLRGAAVGIYAQVAGAEVDKDWATVEKLSKEKRLKGYAALQNFKEALKLMGMAKECKDDGPCYGKKLEDTKLTPGQRLKAAVMIGIVANGREAIPSLTRVLPERDYPLLRQMVLLSATRITTVNDKEFFKMLTKIETRDARRKAKFTGGVAIHNSLALELIKRKQQPGDAGN